MDFLKTKKPGDRTDFAYDMCSSMSFFVILDGF